MSFRDVGMEGKEGNLFFISQVRFVEWKTGKWWGNERRRAYLKIGKTDNAAEIVEYGDLRYGRRVETRNALPG